MANFRFSRKRKIHEWAAKRGVFTFGQVMSSFSLSSKATHASLYLLVSSGLIKHLDLGKNLGERKRYECIVKPDKIFGEEITLRDLIDTMLKKVYTITGHGGPVGVFVPYDEYLKLIGEESERTN